MHLLWSTITVHAIYTCAGISGGYILALMKKIFYNKLKRWKETLYSDMHLVNYLWRNRRSCI